ncbi:hypothetical protein DPMN_067142 [Dreissena polymorpha]|uniref:Uncharacterized protein n=1 Tax=Dreissena polymorpha TaxID=45954 RepID=A0A9D4BL42_DREPO|nr:hypothetical protein DPMN_067142 [Dreissena polymorpha]
MVKLTTFEEQSACPCRKNVRFNFGYKPDMSDGRQEVTSGHSPIFDRSLPSGGGAERSPNQSASAQSQRSLQRANPAWGALFQSREAFVEMHLA